MANKKLFVVGALTALLAFPFIGLAFAIPDQPGVISLSINEIIGMLLTIFWSIVVGVVIILFVLSGFIFITAQGDPGKIAQGRRAVIWGIAGIVVIILSFAIVTIVKNSF